MIYEFDGRRPEIGEGAYVSEQAVVIGDVKIGPGCYVGPGAVIRGDYGSIVIGEGTAVEEGVVIHAPPKGLNRIGSRVTLGHGAIVHSAELGDGAVVGMNAVTSIGAVIGKNSIVAEGAVVKMRQRIPERVVAGGTPARVIREVSAAELESWAEAKQVYVDLAGKYLRLGLKKISE